jgi:hypothetical protein
MQNFSEIIKDWCESSNRTVLENLEYMENMKNMETSENVNLESFLPDFSNISYDNNIIINRTIDRRIDNIDLNNENENQLPIEYQLNTYCNLL